MTPAEAAATIRDVRDYRQGLTGRAAGTIWMIWGLALAVVATAEMGIIHLLDTSNAGEGFGVVRGAVGPALVGITAFVAAIVASNAVWRSHAIAHDERHRPWVAWATAAGIVAVFEIVGLTLLFALSANVGPDDPAFTYVFISPFFSAGVAAALTFLLRRRVRVLPGILASVALEAVVGVALLLNGALEEKVTLAASLHAIVALLALGGAGLWHFRRG